MSSIGSPIAGETVDFLRTATTDDQGDDEDNQQFDSPSDGNDSGTDQFSSDDQETLTTGGHFDVTRNLTVQDGAGTTETFNDQISDSFNETGNFNNDDQGEEDYSDANSLPTEKWGQVQLFLHTDRRVPRDSIALA